MRDHDPSHEPLDYATPAPSDAGVIWSRVGVVCGVLAFPAFCGSVALLDQKILLGLLLPPTLAMLAVGLGIVAWRLTPIERRGWRCNAVRSITFGVAGLLACVAFVYLSTQMGRARETAQRVKCASNLRQIGLAAILYTNDQPDGAFPPDLATFLASGDLSGNTLVCPTTRHQPATAPPLKLGDTLDYLYVGGDCTYRTPATVPVAFEPLSNHDVRGYPRGGNVLYADGHVTFEPPATVRQLVHAAQAAGRLSAADAAAVLDVPGR